MRRTKVGLAAALSVAAMMLVAPAFASAQLSGAIFTTVANGSEVNFNQYPSKEAVYLDGGPGPGAPQGAAGLPDGTYVFQVTNPSGKTLLSTDPAMCRQVVVSGGIISGVVATGCQHVTGTDIDHGAVTVQLMPYADTPNNGGVYKAWMTPLAGYLAGCAALGKPDGLAEVDCGNTPGNRHGFIPDNSKTDNFKVKAQPVVEIDTRFHAAVGGALIDGLGVTWTDPLGASNHKWSYYAPLLQVFHEAHVEGVETGTHYITIGNQPGCDVRSVRYGNTVWPGPTTVPVTIKSDNKDLTVVIDVTCW